MIENPGIIPNYSGGIIFNLFKEKDFDNWFDDLKNIIPPESHPIIYNNWFDREEIDLDLFKTKVLYDSGLGGIIFPRESKEIPEPVEEKKSKNVPPEQLGIIQTEIRDLSLQQALKGMADKTWELTIEAQGPVFPDEIRKALGYHSLWVMDQFTWGVFEGAARASSTILRINKYRQLNG